MITPHGASREYCWSVAYRRFLYFRQRLGDIVKNAELARCLHVVTQEPAWQAGQSSVTWRCAEQMEYQVRVHGPQPFG